MKHSKCENFVSALELFFFANWAFTWMFYKNGFVFGESGNKLTLIDFRQSGKLSGCHYH